jgi:hypothetical protein
MSADLAMPPEDPDVAAMVAAALFVVPNQITAALNHIHRIRGLIDPDRAAAAIGISRQAYDELSGSESRVNRRIVSMAAERLDLGNTSLPRGRLHLPIPKSRSDVLDAGCTLGLIASLAMRGSVMTRIEYDQLVEEFGETLVKYAIGLRRVGKSIAADFSLPLTKNAAQSYGCDVLVQWAKQATPALAGLIQTAMPLGVGEGRVHIKQDTMALDELMISVIEYHWRDQEPQI